MSMIFGFINLDRRPAESMICEKLAASFKRWSRGTISLSCQKNSAFGHSLVAVSPEDLHERMPLFEPGTGLHFTAAGRLDNRDELCEMFDIPASSRDSVSNGELMFRSWKKWQEKAPVHLFGDWSFAVYNESENTAFIARDHIGNTGLSYYYSHSLLVFSSNIEGVLAHPEIKTVFDEVKLAEFLIIKALNSEKNSTNWKNIFSLPMSSTLSIDANGKLSENTYWRLIESPRIKFKKEEDYFDKFLWLYERAVNSRLRSLRPIASTLSAGLDSGSITSLAAKELQKQNRRLTAYTSVPVHNSDKFAPGALVNEWKIASSIAEKYQNIDHLAVNAANESPFAAIRHAVSLFKAPLHAGVNMFWINAINRECMQNNYGVLLTGQMGNLGVTWDGGRNRIYDLFASGKWKAGKKALIEWHKYHSSTLYKAIRNHILAPAVGPLWRKRKQLYNFSSISESAFFSAVYPGPISREFANRVTVPETKKSGLLSGTFPEPTDYRKQREFGFQNNVNMAGKIWHLFSDAHGIEVRDPTGDVRLIEFCVGIPDYIHNYMGGERMLVRESLKGIMPDESRLNTIRGKQAADIGFRLLDHANEIESEINAICIDREISHYIDTGGMRETWNKLKQNRSESESMSAGAYLTRGFMAASFLRNSKL
ncbi:MAG: hypothetical protein HQM10_02805 [Candidatus Riflebacteria bacterium]|nr:hypothetical protein [Candidatus Riflebacteria bacterium]